MSDSETLAVYDAKIDDYTKLTAAVPGKSLRNFVAAMPDGGRVLDLGCGPGAAAREMGTAGLETFACDASIEMAKAAAKHPGVSARQGDFWSLAEDGPFDGIYANFSLLHATRDDCKTHIANCHKAMNPGGRLHLGMKLGEGEERDHLGRFYTYYSEDELCQIVTDAGFTVEGYTTGSEPGLAGTNDPFILLTAHA